MALAQKSEGMVQAYIDVLVDGLFLSHQAIEELRVLDTKAPHNLLADPNIKSFYAHYKDCLGPIPTVLDFAQWDAALKKIIYCNI